MRSRGALLHPAGDPSSVDTLAGGPVEAGSTPTSAGPGSLGIRAWGAALAGRAAGGLCPPRGGPHASSLGARSVWNASCLGGLMVTLDLTSRRSPGGSRAVRAARLATTLSLAAFAVGGAACQKGPDRRDELAPASSGPMHATTIHQPARLSGVETGRLDADGSRERVSCVSCHSLRKEQGVPSAASELDQFHKGLVVKHGSLDCASCHTYTEGGGPGLRLASGATLPPTETMRLCAQCHGPQYRDYTHGSHGGMTGYWDKTRGPRLRNHCVDCHDPHVPAYERTRPVLEPVDRGTAPAAHAPQPRSP